MQAEAIAPRACRFDIVVPFSVRELGAVQFAFDPRQAIEQRLAVGHHEARDAAQHIGPAGRQMKLRLAHIDPHIVGRDHDERIARVAQARDVEERRETLVRDAHVDVLELHDIAEILGGTVETAFHVHPSGAVFPGILGRGPVPVNPGLVSTTPRSPTLGALY